jgi:hypothetical protein
MKSLMKIVRYLVVAVVLVLLAIPLGLWILIARPAFTPYTSHDKLADSHQLYRHVQMLSEELAPRNFESVENLNKAADYIKTTFEKRGLTPEEQVYEVDGVSYRNILVHLGPKEGAKLVLGAHYDAAGLLPGADDNASGVAGLLELSRILQTLPLTRPVTLVAYTLEEPPFYNTEHMGSLMHARSERAKGTEIELMVSVEMIGYFSDEDDSQSFPIGLLSWFYPTTGNFIAVIDELGSNQARRVKIAMADNMSVPVYSMNAPKSIQGIDFSDHRSYWAEGYSAVMVTDTSFYRNTMYHTEHDTIDRLDFDKMSEVVNGLYSLVKQYQ